MGLTGSDTVNAQWLSALSSAQKKNCAEERTVEPEWRLKKKKYSRKKLSDTFGWRKCFQLLNISAGLGSTQRLHVWNCHRDERRSGTSAACVYVCVRSSVNVSSRTEKESFFLLIYWGWRLDKWWNIHTLHHPTATSLIKARQLFFEVNLWTREITLIVCARMLWYLLFLLLEPLNDWWFIDYQQLMIDNHSFLRPSLEPISPDKCRCGCLSWWWRVLPRYVLQSCLWIWIKDDLTPTSRQGCWLFTPSKHNSSWIVPETN